MVALDGAGRGRPVGMTQMGGEGAQWIGLAPFTDDAHYFQNLGDGTFFHSGSLAIRAAVAAGVDITYKLLFNQAVAMTGGQHPEGLFDVPTLTRWLAVEGVRQVVVTTPDPSTYDGVELDPIAVVRHRDELADVQAELGRVPGVTVLVHDDRCAAEERRLRKRGKLPTPPETVWINERVCEGCGDCGTKSTCLSVVPVETDLGRKTAIHQGSCNKDFSCLDGDCPSFVVVTPRRERRRAPTPGPGRGHGEPRPTTARPAPDEPPACPHRRWTSRHRRCGRPTGRLSSACPGSAAPASSPSRGSSRWRAHLDGRYAAGVEQTGLAQKGGPVVADVRIADRPVEGTARAGRRSVDLLLGFDLLGAASPPNLAVADRERTVAVVNTAAVPTAAMVHDITVAFPPPSDVTGRIDAETQAAANVYVNAEWIAEQVADDHLTTNMVLVGAAYQHGCLPVTDASLEAAITLNGVAVDENVAAFRWGRAAVVDPVAVTRALSATGSAGTPARLADGVTADALAAAERDVAGAGLPEALRPMIAARVADLADYQARRLRRRLPARGRRRRRGRAGSVPRRRPGRHPGVRAPACTS